MRPIVSMMLLLNLLIALTMHGQMANAAANGKPQATAAVTDVSLDGNAMRQDAQLLDAVPHRLAGSNHGRTAGDIIIDRLKTAGIDDTQILVQSFPITNGYLRDEAKPPTLTIAGRTISVQPLRANGLMLSITPPDGLTGQLVNVGNCDWSSLPDSLNGKIALVSAKAGTQWLRLMSLSPIAIVFETPQDAKVQRWLDAQVNLPRFEVSTQDAQLLASLAGESVQATIDAQLEYRKSLARNIIVNLPGAADSRFAKDEAVLMLAAYDSAGPTPFHAHLQQQTANIAGLIHTAKWLKNHPPARPVTLVFLDGHAQAQSGQLWFQWMRITGQQAIDQLVTHRQTDHTWTNQITESLQVPANIVTLAPASSLASQSQRMVNDLARDRSDELVTELSIARLALARFERQLHFHPEKQNDTTETQRQKLTADVTQYEQIRDDILAGRRLLRQGLLTADAQTPINPFIAGLFDDARQKFALRDSELNVEIDWLKETSRIAQALAGHRYVMAFYFDLPTADSPWLMTLPSTQTSGFVTNQHAAREVGNLAQSLFGNGSSPEILNLDPMATPTAVTATMTWTLDFGHYGQADPHTTEWPAHFAQRFSDALRLAIATIDLDSVSNVRLPSSSSALQFNIPSFSQPGMYDASMSRSFNEQTKLGGPTANAVIQIKPRSSSAYIRPTGSDLPYTLAMSDQTGSFWFMALTQGQASVQTQGAIFDPQGKLQYISQYTPTGGRGGTGTWDTASWYLTRDKIQLLLFRVRNQQIFTDLTSLTQLISPAAIKIINGTSDSPLSELHASSDQGVYALQTGSVSSVKVLTSSMLLLNNDSDAPLGSGFKPGNPPINALSSSAYDLWRLNESRLNRLRRHGIDLPWIEQVHTQAEASLDQAARSQDKGAKVANYIISSTYSHRVYQPIRDVTNDLIHSVVILLMLAIPFAYACERLVLGSGNVFKQIVSFSGIFLCTFFVLFWVHPAFRFAGYPLIVLLAFLIIVMSALVIWIMWNKFEYEMRRFHGVATASHQNTRDARATVNAAIAQGIATMKRRPLRTALTMATIAILTFTVLFFGAFSSEPSVRWINLGINTHPSMIVIRPAPASPWTPSLRDTLTESWSDKAVIFSRSWDVAPLALPWIGRTPDQKVLEAQAWIGMPPQDFETLPKLKESITGDIKAFTTVGGILLPGKIDPQWIGQPCQFMERTYIIRGSFDPAKIMDVRTADDAPVLALDVSEMRARLTREFPGDNEAVNQRLLDIDAGEYPTIDAEQSVLISTTDPNLPNDQLQAIVLLTQHDDDVKPIASTLTVLLNRSLFANTQGKAQRAVFYNQLQLGGLWAIAVPLLLGGLLVFSSMMSSVSDRQREIFTLSALGLAPRHIMLLFFAEATVYGLVGSMTGYLGAQIFAKVAAAMGRLGWIDPPPLNYSSTNAVITLVVIIVAVLVSTIYPALKASRSANPGIQRSWRMPSPMDDKLELEFPFTVSHDDMTGLIMYLREYFDQHSDQTIGGFAAKHVDIGCSPENAYHINADIWLSPFDQGVTQTFTMHTQNSDIEGVDRVFLAMKRTGGSPAMWTRGNKLFVAQLREQFLLWRTLPDVTIDQYHEQGQNHFEGNIPLTA